MSLLPIRLYQILREHSDRDHLLPMGELRRRLREDYGLSCDRRTVYAALDRLRQAGCDIPAYGEGGEGYCLLSRPLTPAQVRLLLDAAALSPAISSQQYDALAATLTEGLSRYQRERCRPTTLSGQRRGMGPEGLNALEGLEQAMAEGRQARFYYTAYELDKQLHPQEPPCQVSPWGLCFAQGVYYLLFHREGAPTPGHCRVDRIWGLTVLEEAAEPLPDDLVLSRYIREKVCPQTGTRIAMRCRLELLEAVLDQFGQGTILRASGEDAFDAVVAAEPEAAREWAMGRLPLCEILAPASLRREMAEALRQGLNMYLQ